MKEDENIEFEIVDESSTIDFYYNDEYFPYNIDLKEHEKIRSDNRIYLIKISTIGLFLLILIVCNLIFIKIQDQKTVESDKKIEIIETLRSVSPTKNVNSDELVIAVKDGSNNFYFTTENFNSFYKNIAYGLSSVVIITSIVFIGINVYQINQNLPSLLPVLRLVLK
ncbi:hypothetical protein HERIO_1835 [Hepatospora eriocheir]|uniref:Uncharacterized protein n=1 Tax=Hepatospora eriocheir TaxID=1081669 RepID=A0A1X0Q950_9MICR|nr:hypothetical protein HERIO_1835 [Hepatospora eriocheir]